MSEQRGEIDPPMPQDLRTLIAIVVWGSTLPGPTAVLYERLPQIQQYLQAHEKVDTDRKTAPEVAADVVRLAQSAAGW